MNESKKLTTIILWALLPIVCFACAISLTNWFASEKKVQTSSDYKDLAWGIIVASSPDIVFQDPDSIKYYGWQKKVNLKKDSIMAADITHLFPQSGVRKLTILNAAVLNPLFEVWNYNGTVYTGLIARQTDGCFVLNVNSNNEAKIIPIGRFSGRIVIPDKSGFDKPLTTMNVVAIVTLLMCILGFGLILTSTHLAFDSMDWLMPVSIISTLIPLAYVILWLFGIWHKGSVYNYPEWIALAWLISEVGLLSGVIFSLNVHKTVPKENIFVSNLEKLKSNFAPIGEWNEVGGEDSLIINSDGTMYYTSSGQTSKLTFTISDNGCFITTDAEGNVALLRYDIHPCSPWYEPIIKFTYGGKTFTYRGRSYEEEAEYYINENKEQDVLKEVMKSLRLPEEDGSWAWVIVDAIAMVGCGFLFWHLYPRTADRIGAIMFGILALVALCNLIINLRHISRRKLKARVKKLFWRAYSKLPQPMLTEYIKAALKQSDLSVEEWQEQHKENIQ